MTVMEVHAALTAKDIEASADSSHQVLFPTSLHSAQAQLRPAFAACRREPDMTVIIFLDEVNTAPLRPQISARTCACASRVQ